METYDRKHDQSKMTSDSFKATVLASSEAEMLFQITKKTFDRPSASIAADDLIRGPVCSICEEIHVRSRITVLLDGMIVRKGFAEKTVPILPFDDDQLRWMGQPVQGHLKT